MAENIKVLGCAIITLFIFLLYFHGNWMSYIQKCWTPSSPSSWLNPGIHLLRHIISVVHKEIECLLATVHDMQTIVLIYKTNMIKQRGQLWKSRKKKIWFSVLVCSLSFLLPFAHHFLSNFSCLFPIFLLCPFLSPFSFYFLRWSDFFAG